MVISCTCRKPVITNFGFLFFLLQSVQASHFGVFVHSSSFCVVMRDKACCSCPIALPAKPVAKISFNITLLTIFFLKWLVVNKFLVLFCFCFFPSSSVSLWERINDTNEFKITTILVYLFSRNVNIGISVLILSGVRSIFRTAFFFILQIVVGGRGPSCIPRWPQIQLLNVSSSSLQLCPLYPR